ncbi:MAG: peptidylprolyl isomerase [Bdellovibrio sp.]
MKIRASHILVQQKYEADDILRLLQNGQDFAALAKKYSTCSSASQGGDLGLVALGRLDETFEEAVLCLKVGETSKAPVRTRFGYHLIKRVV